MGVKTTGVIIDGPQESLHIQFTKAPNAKEVKAFVFANMGQEVEVILAGMDELREDTPVAGEKKKTYSPCASPGYWKNKR